MTDSDPSLDRRKFVAALAKFVSPMDTAGATSAMMAMLPALAHLPERLFDDPAGLAIEVGADWDRVPTMARLRRALEVRAERDKPTRARVDTSELDQAALTAEDRAAVRLWLEHDLNNSLPARDMVLRLAVVRSKHSPGFDWLMVHNTRACDMASAQGWTPVDREGDYADPGRILASVRRIVDPPHPHARFWLAALRAAVEHHAPTLVDLVPPVPEALEGGSDRQPTPQQYADMRADAGIVRVERDPDGASIEPPTRRPGTLTPEQLLAIRLNNPALRAVSERQAAEALRQRLTPANDATPPPIPPPRPAMPWDDVP